ncbi:MAG: MFS transporter [Planctomycetota bacterium]|nr:MFS transporter [Planctomycetota bacterium]
MFKKLFAPAAVVPRRADDDIRRLYPLYRLNILTTTYIGYALFYLLRNNLSTVSKEIEGALSYDHSMIGDILAVSAIAYGLGKFFMGSLSDRSDPRKFMAFGLLLSAVCNVAFGSITNYYLHICVWCVNGFVQGMGWPPCGRSIGHWFSVRERGFVFSIWNTATNVGGGLAGVLAAWAALHYGGWQYAFYFPAAVCTLGAAFLFWRMRDTPQSVGLPPIEEYKNDYTAAELEGETHERELSTRELFVGHILTNRLLWLVAFANFFVYIVRYSMLDWGPLYFREVKGFSLEGGGFVIFVLEFGGIPSTILMGWLSDKLGGRRGMVSFLCMFPVLIAFAAMRLNPPGHAWFDMLMLAVIGFFVYPPVMLLALAALDLTSKKAVGTAAGFVGLFGYIGRTVQAKGFGWMSEHYGTLYGKEVGWNMVISAILACGVAAIVLLAFTWKVRPRA